MKRKQQGIRAVAVVLALCCLLSAAALAASPAVRAANALYTLGLFQGVGQHSDGSPVYALDKTLTRQEAVVLLIRLLGLEQLALTSQSPQPFSDVDGWAAPYVALAYERGYVRGVSDTRLDAHTPVDERGWLTFLLRALGYAEASYDDPWALSDSIGLTHGASTGFTRASAVTLSMDALGLPCAGGTDTLLRALLDAGAVTEQEIRNAGLTEALARRSLSAKEVSARCADAVLYLEVYESQRDLEFGRLKGTGSGFFVDGDGVALTNYHVVEGTAFAFAVTNDGKRYQVQRVLFADAERDLAVIRLGKAVLDEDNQPTGAVTAAFPSLTMRSAETIANGDIVYAIGSPLGLANSISDGIVANRSRLVATASSPDPYIQVTAAISPGSSGGVLLNEYGEAIGITTATFAYGQNLNLAVPLDKLLNQDLSAEGAPYETYFEVETSPYANVTKYERYPDVPDFGAVTDAPLLGEGESEDGWFYLYAAEKADEDALAAYYLAMEEWNFDYAYDVTAGEMVFTNGTLTVYGGEVTLADETYYRIRIAAGTPDTTALQKNIFPWQA